MRFRLAQCLCPKRHAIFAMAVHDPATSTPDLLQMLQEAVGALIRGQGALFDAPVNKMNPWCGLCGAKGPEGWLYEVALSKEYPSWDEAQKVLKEVGEMQQKTRELMDLLGFSYESKLWQARAERN